MAAITTTRTPTVQRRRVPRRARAKQPRHQPTQRPTLYGRTIDVIVLECLVAGVACDTAKARGFYRMLRRKMLVHNLKRWLGLKRTNCMVIGVTRRRYHDVYEVIIKPDVDRPEPGTAHFYLNEGMAPRGRSIKHGAIKLGAGWVCDYSTVSLWPEHSAA